MGLKLAADAAVPFDYGALPAGTAAVIGYVGGDTPHAWTTAEIAAAEKAVGAWWAIWTAPSTGEVLTAAQGERDADGMVAALIARGYPTDRPVFYDVERGTWDASPSGARAAVAAWTKTMGAHGWARAYGYLPPDDGHGWIYDWVSERPTTLPAGWIGQQYESTDAYDLSVFDESLWEDEVTPQDIDKIAEAVQAKLNKNVFTGRDKEPHEVRTLVQEEIAATVPGIVAAEVDRVVAALGRLYRDSDGKHPAALTHIFDAVESKKT